MMHGEDSPPETLPAPGTELPKSPALRWLDVAVLGPFMLYSALDKRPPGILRAGLAIAGVVTIVSGLQHLRARERALQAAHIGLEGGNLLQPQGNRENLAGCKCHALGRM